MKLVKPGFEILEQEPSYEGMLRHIERCGRTCYKSEDKITKDSAKKFVDMIINRGHTAVLEQGTVYLAIPMTTYCPEAVNTYIDNPYSVVNECNDFVFTDKYGNEVCAWCVTTNYRVLLENDCLEDLEFLCEPTKYHTKRITVKFICDRGVSHEFVRHRVFSFAQESTRYCNYSKDKFGNELTFIVPNWIDIPEEVLSIDNVEYWELRNGEDFGHIGNLSEKIDLPILKETCRYLDTLKQSERSYFQLLQLGWKPQQARAVLPNSLKTELIMTGTIDQWKGFFKLRDAKDAHPQARELSQPLHEEFIKRGWLV
jgi:thymidylate synthase (FAD)|nr:MAG TPA: Thymidylate synthase complementing protein [Caudoviricetes sp.]